MDRALPAITLGMSAPFSRAAKPLLSRRPGSYHTRAMHACCRTPLLALLIALTAIPACDRPAVREPPTAIQVRTLRPSRHRARVAAVNLRFAHSGLEPGSIAAGYDRLQVVGVFADSDRRDVGLVGDLVGTASRRLRLPEIDSCVRASGPLDAAARQAIKPHAHVQLLDVGNLRLLAGDRSLALRIAMVPSLFSAVRGVRYDAEVDRARSLLAGGELTVVATGGDGVPPFRAPIRVPRPVRLTRVGGLAVRGGHVVVAERAPSLNLRWGSVDGRGGLLLVIGAERGKGLDWVRCRLIDDGDFTLPAAVLSDLPKRTVRQPWLLSLVRSTTAPLPGFPGTPLRLELVDSVRLQ